MLTASSSTPNSRQSDLRPAPTPGNWFGVCEGMDQARNLIRQGQLPQAEKVIVELLEFAPSETAAWRLLARIQRKLGKIEAGIASANRALKLQNMQQTQRAAASPTLAKLLWQQHEKGQAIAMLNSLMAENPDDPSLLALKATWDEESDS